MISNPNDLSEFSEEDIDIAHRVAKKYYDKKQELEEVRSTLTPEEYKDRKNHLFSQAYTETTGSTNRNGDFAKISKICRLLYPKKDTKKEVVKPETAPDLFSIAGVKID